MRESLRLRATRLLCSRLQPLGAAALSRVLYPYERGRSDRTEFAVRSKTGSIFIGNTADVHAHPFAVNQCGEWRNWAIALAVCRPGDVIVEVGANVGTETVGYSDIVGSEGRVLAFEPLPAHLERLGRAIAGFRYTNVRLMPFALSDGQRTEEFAVPSASVSQGIGHILGPEERRTGTTTYYDSAEEMGLIEVETRSLDQFSTEVSGMRLLVADAEGWEISILGGGAGVIDHERPIIVLEASDPHQRRSGFSLEELHEQVRDLGYVPYWIGGMSLTEVRAPEDAPRHSNWLCVSADDSLTVQLIRRMLRRCALTPCVLGLNPLMAPAR